MQIVWQRADGKSVSESMSVAHYDQNVTKLCGTLYFVADVVLGFSVAQR